MAAIDVKHLVYAKVVETSSAISYINGAILAKGINVNTVITTDKTKFYGDGGLIKTLEKFISGSVALNVNRISAALKIALLGYTEGAALDAAIGSKELSAGKNTIPADVGIGYCIPEVNDDGSISWETTWLKKVQFSNPNKDATTIADKLTPKTQTLNGTVMEAVDGYYIEEGEFGTESGAFAWLDAKAGISTDPSVGLTALAFTNGALTPAFSAAKYTYSCLATDAVEITATAAGIIKLYVDGIFNQILTTTVKGTAVPMSAGDNKLFTIIVQESGKTAKTTNIIVQRAA